MSGIGNSKPLTKDEKPIAFLFENSLFLIIGAIVALVWANTNKSTYDHFFKFELQHLFVDKGEHDHEHTAEKHDGEKSPSSSDEDTDQDKDADQDKEDGHDDDNHEKSDKSHVADHGDSGDHGHSHPINIQFIINDVLMALFFAIAGKEIFEAILPGGPLAGFRKASMPLIATLGGILGPVIIYVAGVLMFSDWETLGRGWAIPTATDIAFSYLVARIIFGKGHPAIAFLLLLAIADDAAGLCIIAVFYPKGDLAPEWLLLCVGSMAMAFTMARFKIHSFWWYLLIPGALSWISFFMAGIHPALGLVPVIPFMPHAKSDLGLFVHDKLNRHDTLNEFEHWWKNPVEIILGLFGLCNAGVVLSSVGTGTWLVLAALIVGKPVGVLVCTLAGRYGLKLELPKGMDLRDTLVVGAIAGIGFTVALFVSSAAFVDGTPQLDQVKMGALGSFFAAVVSFVLAKALGVKKYNGDDESAEESGADSDSEIEDEKQQEEPAMA